MTAEAVIWDIGNVFVRWDPRTLYSRIFPDPVERDRFLSCVCTMAWRTRHDLGVSFAENRAPLLARFPEHAEAIRAWETRWWEPARSRRPRPPSRPAHEGVMKPDPALYAIACDRFGLASGDVLFFDDSEKNVASARAFGFDVRHMTDPAGVRPALAARGLL